MIKMVLELKKFDVKEQELINRALKKLERQITTFESTGTPFEKIFNNDAIKIIILQFKLPGCPPLFICIQSGFMNIVYIKSITKL